MVKKNILIVLLGLGMCSYAQSPIRTGKDYALFFVVTEYKHWGNLPGIDKNIKNIGKTLQEDYGFEQPDIRINLTGDQILGTLTNYQNRSFGDGDQLFVFFSMHGYYDGTMGAIIPFDGLANDPTYRSWITHPNLEALITKINCKHILLSIDACYSGTFGQQSKSKPDAPDWEMANDCKDKCLKALRYKSRLYLTSGGKERTPSESQFARKWLEALRERNHDGILGFHELYAILQEATPTPMFGDFKDHEKGGSFIFVHKNTCISPNQGIPNYRPPSPLDKDNDQDGIANDDDFCPEVSGIRENEGCPIGGMIFIPGGTFDMGTGNSGRRVNIRSFYASTTEVSVDEYMEFTKATGKNFPEWLSPGSVYHIENGDNSYYKSMMPRLEQPDSPIVGVSWFDAIEYCNWKSKKDNLQPVYIVSGQNVQANWNANGYRLPTEAEWEYMARLSSKIKAGSQRNDYLQAVNQGTQNSTGFFCLFHNAAEWCWDWFDKNYYSRTSNNNQNPVGPFSGIFRTFRGGSFARSINVAEAYKRFYAKPQAKYNDIGFRVVKNKN